MFITEQVYYDQLGEMDSRQINVIWDAEITREQQYCSVLEVIKLFDKLFDGSERNLREFVDDFSRVFE
jgi:hypothetical protein